MACPDGQYFCHDRGKCMPIPKGHKVRKDGELVKEAVKGQDTASRREGAKERAAEKKSGKIRQNTLSPKDYATQQKKSIEWHDKRTKGRYIPGQISDVNEVAPPGWGHTKAEKEKTKPNKPKSKIGGTAAAFKRALDRGDFKGLPGDKTKKEKTASMFKLMWSMKKKGDKPHYKPGTDEKYEKYKDKDEKNESFVLEREDSPYERASDKALDKKYGYGTSHDKGPKTGFGRASNRATAAAVLKDIRRRRSKSTSETRADAAHKGWSHTARTSKDQTPEKKATRKKLADTPYKNLPKDEQEKDQVAADAVKKEYDKKYKKYQEEQVLHETMSGKDAKKLEKASVLSYSDNPKDQDRARARQVDVDYKDLLRQLKAKKKKKYNESVGFEIDTPEHNKVKKKGKMRRLALGNKNPNEKKTAERMAGGPKLYGESSYSEWRKKASDAVKRVVGKKTIKKHEYPGRDAGDVARQTLDQRQREKSVGPFKPIDYRGI